MLEAMNEVDARAEQGNESSRHASSEGIGPRAPSRAFAGLLDVGHWNERDHIEVRPRLKGRYSGGMPKQGSPQSVLAMRV